MVNRVGSYIMTKLKISIFQSESTVFILNTGPDSGRLTEVHGLVSKIEADIL